MVGIPMLIGWQTSVYTEAERNSKIYIEQSKVYDHKLMFTIPEGYHLENIENHNFERVFEKKGREIAAFRSKASIEGNQLVLTVHEFYERGFYAPEYYADFQAVINGAYEFYISKCRLVENE